MGRSSVTAGLVLLAVSSCAHAPLSSEALDRVERPAFVARLLPEAGPKALVFQSDSAWSEKLSGMKLDAKEADRRLQDKLANGRRSDKGELEIPSMSRFEVADSLRADILARLPKRAPWNAVVDPAKVAGLLESLLVTEAKATTPEYARLKDVGADVVIDLLIEEYGMHAAQGRAGVFIVGTARMFRLDGQELYVRRFYSDDVRAGLESLDPFAAAKNPTLFRDRVRTMISAIGTQLARDLNPHEFPNP